MEFCLAANKPAIKGDISAQFLHMMNESRKASCPVQRAWIYIPASYFLRSSNKRAFNTGCLPNWNSRLFPWELCFVAFQSPQNSIYLCVLTTGTHYMYPYRILANLGSNFCVSEWPINFFMLFCQCIICVGLLDVTILPFWVFLDQWGVGDVICTT